MSAETNTRARWLLDIAETIIGLDTDEGKFVARIAQDLQQQGPASTPADMAAALEAAKAEGWDRCYGDRPLMYGPDGRGKGPVQNPYRPTPDTGHGDWTLPSTYPAGDFCGQCMQPLDLSGDLPGMAPWPCEMDFLHCKGCASRCPSCRYEGGDEHTPASWVSAL